MKQPVNASEATQPVPLTITALTQWIRHTLESATPDLLWITGEVSNFSQPRSGHWYFTLKDAGAQIRCVFFGGYHAAQQWTPGLGDQVLVAARMSVYEARGDYQLMVVHLRPEGAGTLEAAIMAIRARLGEQGLFNPERKRPIPQYPERIALVTSPTGAAIQDVLRTLGNRYPLAAITVFETLVQGMGAAANIARALKAASNSDCDVVLLVRGGGSLEDLWAYREAEVAYAIYQCRIPVITGVGHENDTTTADFVADARASTPTGAAVLATPDQEHLFAVIRQYQKQLAHHIRHRWDRARHLLQVYQHKLRQRLPNAAPHQHRLVITTTALHQAMAQKLNNQQQRYTELVQRLSDLNPAHILARGYARVTSDGVSITRAAQCHDGQLIQLHFMDGQITCRTQPPIKQNDLKTI
ncbi:MAG: exodeoxyribonuclease VII large subunit [Pseudomonadota bacterium]